jgi:hypothetical protein
VAANCGLEFLNMSTLLSPKETVIQFMNEFNRENYAGIDAVFTSPAAYLVGGEVRVFSKYAEHLNFDDLRATGWVRTELDSIETVMDDNSSVLIRVTLTRFRSNDTEHSTGDGCYLLEQDHGRWKIRLVIVMAGSLGLQNTK